MWASRFSVLRTQFGLNGGDAFLTSGNYLHGSAGHWYLFHRNGRWEPQFNIGMFGGGPGQPRYLRIGLGAGLSSASADPNREAGFRQLRSLFMNMQWLARSSRSSVLTDALALGAPLVEAIDIPTPSAVTPESAVHWLAHVDAGSTPWVFVGRKLSPDAEADRDTLGDFEELMFEITRTLDVWLPVWEAVMRGPE